MIRYGCFLRPRLTGSGGVSGVATGNGGGGFDLRFNLSRKTRCAFRLGEAPWTVGFSISCLLSCHFAPFTGKILPDTLASPARSTKFRDGFGDDRTTRAHYRFADPA